MKAFLWYMDTTPNIKYNMKKNPCSLSQVATGTAMKKQDVKRHVTRLRHLMGLSNKDYSRGVACEYSHACHFSGDGLYHNWTAFFLQRSGMLSGASKSSVLASPLSEALTYYFITEIKLY